jgi:hypothetical protein
MDVDEVLAQLPERMGEEGLVTLICSIILQYCDSPRDSRELVKAIVEELVAFYDENPCQCATCVAARKKGMN